MISVLVADDQDLVRDGLVAIVEAEADMTLVGEAADGHQAVVLAGETSPDVVVMDIRMPGLDGVAAARQILDQPRPPYVLMLTTFDLDEYVLAALQAGASGFLLKDAPRDRLTEAIRRVASGEAQLAPSVTARLIEQVRVAPPVHRFGAPTMPALTPREDDCLRLLAGGLSNAEIAQRLHLSETTVKSYVSTLLAKLGVRDRVQAIVMAYETGHIRPGASPVS